MHWDSKTFCPRLVALRRTTRHTVLERRPQEAQLCHLEDLKLETWRFFAGVV